MEASKVAKQVSAIKKDENFLEQLIPNAHEWKKQFTSDELHAVYDAVEKKLAQISSLSLEEQAKKLDFEIKYVAAPSFFKPGAVQYPTWQVSQVAYTKQHAKVLESIEWNNINKTLQEAIEFDTKSKPYKELIIELQKAVAIKDKDKAQNILEQMQVKRDSIENKRSKKPKKIKFKDEDFTQERKDGAKYFRNAKDADDYFHDNAVEVWGKASEKERKAVVQYTVGSAYITEPLRAIKGYLTRQSQFHLSGTFDNVCRHF